MERITAVAKGKVQGVGYRHSGSCAHMTGVHGFGRNMPDGSEIHEGILRLAGGWRVQAERIWVTHPTFFKYNLP